MSWAEMVVTGNVSLPVSPEDCARIFCLGTGEDQAAFFNEVARISAGWNAPFALQMQYVTDVPELTKEGRNIMQTIGEYAWPEERP